MSKPGEVLAECIAEQSDIQVFIVQDEAPLRIRIVFKESWSGQHHSTRFVTIKAEDREKLAKAIMPPPIPKVKSAPSPMEAFVQVGAANVAEIAQRCIDYAVNVGTIPLNPKDDAPVIKNRAYRRAMGFAYTTEDERNQTIDEITRLVDEAAGRANGEVPAATTSTKIVPSEVL